MSFQTVLSIVGIIFTAIELYQRFHQKDSSGSVQSPIYSITAEPRAGPEQNQNTAELRAVPRAEPLQSEALTSGGLSRVQSEAPTSEAPSVQKSEWFDNNLFFLPLKCQNKIN